MDLSVIIVNWNTRELLRTCLQSVYLALPPFPIEVIVVDNASVDGSSEMVLKNFPKVLLIQNQQNYGFAKANNQGMKKSTGDFILLLNSDTEIKACAFEHLVDFLKSHPGAGAAGSRLLNPNGTLQTSCYPFPSLSRELWRLLKLDEIVTYGIYKMSTWSQDMVREVDHIQGASLLLRHKALEKVGLLDEDYFMYSEELDLCYRLVQAGWKLYWVPQSMVTHYGGQSTMQAAEKMFIELYRSKILFFRKNYNSFSAYLYKIVLFFISIIRVIASSIARLFQPHYGDKYNVILKNYIRLLYLLPGL